MRLDDLEFDPRKTAADWHSGQSSALYAFASSGAVLPGAADEAQRNVALLNAGYDPGTGDRLATVRASTTELADYLTFIEAEYVSEATANGRAAAENAASWVTDGNLSTGHYRTLLAAIDDGDPAIDDYLPRRPNLSGEFAGDPTPALLADDIIGEPWADQWADILADHWEAAVDERFMEACEENLRAAL